MSPHLSKLIEWFKMQKTGDVANGAGLFHKIKELFMCILNTAFSKIIIYYYC